MRLSARLSFCMFIEYEAERLLLRSFIHGFWPEEGVRSK